VPFRWSADRGAELLPTLGTGGAADGINNDGYIVGTVYSQPTLRPDMGHCGRPTEK
jgi:hypothetical protein